jgi:hypothetical protein
MPAMTRVLRRPTTPETTVLDLDIHGLVGIRLVDPSARDVAAVAAETGAVQGALSREPELTIRFVPALRPKGIRYVEPGETGFTAEEFFVLAPARNEPLAEIPLDLVGRPCRINCRSGVGSVPLLRPILNQTMLAKGALVLHASAFRYEDAGVLVAGWARGGKTTSLLAFMANGAEFIADDHAYVDPDGNRVYGLPEPVSVRAWHLDELPGHRGDVGCLDRTRLRAWSAICRVAASAAARDGRGTLGKLSGRVAGHAEDASIAVAPERLFDRCVFEGTLDKVFLAIAHESSDVFAERVNRDWLADRLAFSLRAERRRLLDHYLAFRYAFPDRPNELIERAAEIERDLLGRVLAGVDTYVVYHPFPAPVAPLFETMAPLVA